MKRSNNLRRGFTSIVSWLKQPLKRYRSLSNNGKLAVYLGLLLLIVGIISIIYVFSAPDENREEATINNFETQLSTLTPIEARISRTDGNVSYKTATGEWTDAEQEVTLVSGDEIRTEGGASRAIVRFENGNELRLDGDTYIRIDAATEEKIESYIINGKTYSRVVSAAIPYSVESENAHYEASGTAFIAESSGDKQSVEVIENSVIETTTNNTISEGNRYIVKSSVNPTDDKKVEELDINTYKNDPFVKWNLEIDRNSDIFKNNLGFLQDTEAPDITITSPKNEDVILTEPSSEKGAVTIEGRADGAVSVVIIAKSVNGSPETTANLSNDGNFKSQPIDSPLGLSVFEIVAKDRAGNTATQSLRVTIQQKSAPADEPDAPLIILISAVYSDNEVTLSWSMSSDIDDSRIRVLYSKNDNPTLDQNDGVWTPSKGNTPPATVTKSFDSGGLDKTAYYFRICQLNDDQNDCEVLSNTMSVDIE